MYLLQWTLYLHVCTSTVHVYTCIKVCSLLFALPFLNSPEHIQKKKNSVREFVCVCVWFPQVNKLPVIVFCHLLFGCKYFLSSANTRLIRHDVRGIHSYTCVCMNRFTFSSSMSGTCVCMWCAISYWFVMLVTQFNLVAMQANAIMNINNYIACMYTCTYSIYLYAWISLWTLLEPQSVSFFNWTNIWNLCNQVFQVSFHLYGFEADDRDIVPFKSAMLIVISGWRQYTCTCTYFVCPYTCTLYYHFYLILTCTCTYLTHSLSVTLCILFTTYMRSRTSVHTQCVHISYYMYMYGCNCKGWYLSRSQTCLLFTRTCTYDMYMYLYIVTCMYVHMHFVLYYDTWSHSIALSVQTLSTIT